MARDRKQVAHEEPAAKSSIITTLNIVTALIAVTAAALGVGYYIWQLKKGVDESLSRLTVVEEELSDVPSTASIATLEGLISDLPSDTAQRLDALEARILDIPTDADIAAVEKRLSNVQGDAATRLAAVESELIDLPNIRELLSRVPSLETRLSQLSDVPSETFDTVYVFKHTFDFPKPPLGLGRNEARDLICTTGELATTDGLREEEEVFRKELATFDGSVDFKFYTVGQERDSLGREGNAGAEGVRTMIRQETACYKRTQEGNETGQDIRITPAPVEIRLQAESAVDRDDNRGTYIQPYNPSFDHDGGDSKTFRFLGLPNHTGLQVHSLTGTIVDRQDPNRRFCREYEIKVATRELDHCDFEVFVFAYLDSPPFPTTEEE